MNFLGLFRPCHHPNVILQLRILSMFDYFLMKFYDNLLLQFHKLLKIAKHLLQILRLGKLQNGLLHLHHFVWYKHIYLFIYSFNKPLLPLNVFECKWNSNVMHGRKIKWKSKMCVCVSGGRGITLYLLRILCSRINRFKTKAIRENGRAFYSWVIDIGNAFTL